jgi:hypothetical protein
MSEQTNPTNSDNVCSPGEASFIQVVKRQLHDDATELAKLIYDIYTEQRDSDRVKSGQSNENVS